MNQIIFPLLLIAFMIIPFQANATNECNSQNPDNCLDGVGPAVTNPDSVRTTVFNVSKQTNSQSSDDDQDLSFIGSSTLTGLAAGDGYVGLGYWASFNYSDFDADIPINSLVQPIASYDADQKTVFIGVDTLLMDALVVGLTLGYENTDIDTAYNGGNNETDGYTIAPYAAYLINDIFSADVVIGYSNLGTDTDRIDNVSGGTILGDFDAERWFVATNLNATVSYEQWLLGGRIGYLYVTEDQDSYFETGPNTARSIGRRHIDLAQVVVGFDVAYSFNKFEPYATFTYLNDLGRDNGTGAGGLPGAVGATQPDDDDEIQAGLGIRYFGNNYSGTAEWTNVIGRDTFDGNNFLLTLRFDL